ncbi:MAG: DUF389 domain-containing protein, partial [Holophagales bacterium]|nr:DUF389 domain-containing protein [Holophagales bacterium]
ATEMALSRNGPTLVVKGPEAAPRLWLGRIWQAVSHPLPMLSDPERIRVQARMRADARAGVDFYLLITLASVIATLGLIQSSAAVIIGAMLVAPLMSPILALGHAMVLGHLRLVRRAFSSTVKGVGLALAVGSAFALLLPSMGISEEMASRGAPGLLDLLVALASGAAAAYAVSRPSVAAALPGVAIAAALVPPLCVAGLGLGASRLGLAGGAFLLFTTNLCAIVLASAAVFLALGFRPIRAVRGRWVWRSIRLVLLLLLVVSIPLGLHTREAFEARRLETRLEHLAHAGPGRGVAFEVQELTIHRRRGGLEAEITVHVYGQAPPDLADRIRTALEREAGEPVAVRVAVLEARIQRSGGGG